MVGANEAPHRDDLAGLFRGRHKMAVSGFVARPGSNRRFAGFVGIPGITGISRIQTSAVLRPLTTYAFRTNWGWYEKRPDLLRKFRSGTQVEPSRFRVLDFKSKSVSETGLYRRNSSEQAAGRQAYAWCTSRGRLVKGTFGVDLPDNSRTRTPDKESAPAQAPYGLQRYLTTCVANPYTEPESRADWCS